MTLLKLAIKDQHCFMLFEKRTKTHPFKQWLYQNKENRQLLYIAGVLIIAQFIAFKLIYPYPNFMPPDSYNYLESAFSNDRVSIWPIGYSKFLRLFSSLTRSDLALVCLQYLLVQLGVLYFLFSIRYLLSPSIWLFRILLLISISNPLLPHISNFIASDALFTSLSLIWFTQLLWIIYNPQRKLLLYHALVLFMAFIVRYNALYYPVISITLILLRNIPKRIKLEGVGSIVILLLIFIGHTQSEYHSQIGKAQFSPFGGWQLAANALYGYRHVIPDSQANIPSKFKELHILVNQHNKALRFVPDFLRPDHKVGVYYLWDFNSPLIEYREIRWKSDSTATYFKKWASMGPFYSEYGRYLIKEHPSHFIKYFIWPNFMRYFSPPAGFLGDYNLNKDSVNRIAANWFGWKTQKIYVNSKDKRIWITNLFSVAYAIINIVFLLSFLGVGVLGAFKHISSYSKFILFMMFGIWLSNMIWSVLTAPIELRYQLFPMIITFVFLYLLIAYLVLKSGQQQPEKT